MFKKLASLNILVCIGVSTLSFSCAHNRQLETQKKQSNRKIRSLQSDLRKQQASIENLKEQNWVLKKKYAKENPAVEQKVPVPFQPSAAIVPVEKPAPAIAVASVVEDRVASAPKAEELPQAEPTDSRESAEHNLYAKVIASYRQKKSADLKRVTEILLKTYPQSVFADRAIYLNARLDFETANDQAALGECEKIIHNYPSANKLVSTYFLKAQILKKQGRINEARSVLADVENYFPGSPESYRVPLELKILSLQAKATQ